jgi:hypothetical protein
LRDEAERGQEAQEKGKGEKTKVGEWMMTQKITRFIQTRHINSYQKLRVLLFFHDHADSSWTNSQIAEQLYLGDGLLLEKIVADLQAAGLVDCVARQCRLCNETGLSVKLQQLVKTCEDPLARQEILNSIRHPDRYLQGGGISND